MKKIILAIFIISISCGLSFGQNYSNYDDINSQDVDRFFTISNVNNQFRTNDTPDGWGIMPSLFGHGLDGNQNGVPTGSGLLLLAGMGLAYGIRRRK